MNIFSKTLAGLALVGALTGAAFAADNGPRPHHDPLHRLQERLGLSDAQVQQLRPVFHAQAEERKAHRGEFRAELQSVLSADQMARLNAEQGQRGHHGLRDLNLTADQRAQLKSFREQNMPAMKAEHKQETAQIMAVLTPDQQAKFKEMRREWRHRHHHHNNNAGQQAPQQAE